NDLLIIAHESVLRVLYGYLMACSAQDIPNLSFPRDEIIEIIPASYNNESRRIHIPGLPQKLIPASPEDIRIPVPPSVVPSGAVSPMSGLGTPAHGTQTPENSVSVTGLLYICFVADPKKPATTRKMHIESIPMWEGSGNNYAYIVTDDKTKDAVVIDPANPSEVLATLKKTIDSGVNLKSIINTHHHHDHAGGNAEM
ncbi:hypothetical protein KC346_g19291, partial [Hortaea werneckii]